MGVDNPRRAKSGLGLQSQNNMRTVPAGASVRTPISCFPASTRAASRTLLEAIARDPVVLDEALARIQAHRALEASRTAFAEKAHVVHVADIVDLDDEHDETPVTFEAMVIKLDQSL